MPDRVRFPRIPGPGLLLTLVLFLMGLGLFLAACQQLADSDTGDEGTTVEVADSAQPFFGLWDGTYTITEVRDQNGPVDDPPVPLNAPLEMHMELHAWSETSGDCGNVTVAGYASGRVLDLFVNGAEVRLSIVNEQEGLRDSLSTMTLTLQDDTLTGVDEPDPSIPSGWYATQGTVYLARATSPVTSTAATSTREDGGGHAESSAEDGTDEHADAGAEEIETPESLFFQAYALTTTTTEREPTYWAWDNSANGETKTVHVGDRIQVMLAFPVAAEWTSLTWSTQEDGGQLNSISQHFWKDGAIIVASTKNYDVTAVGWARIIAQFFAPDGSSGEFFITVSVEE